MINAKYRVRDVAKDFDIKSNYVTELLEKHFEGQKKSMTALESDELDMLFDTITSEHQAESFDDYFALKSGKEQAQPEQAEPKEEPKPEEKKEKKPEGKKPAPKDEKAPSAQVKEGQRVAIVGPTGCGKTTFINLLMRFYDPQGGEILLDGVNTRDMKRGELRRCVGMVLQDTWLKAGTIRENIAMGKPDATQEQVVAAAKLAHAHSFITRLPQGYDTVIGESGGTLSQGQKQLLCIARVMLCLPPMLFLDEATSSIDTRTEIRIQKAFNTMMEGRTSFIVAHRLSTIREADVILVMREGHIVEQGTHDDLLRRNGFYAHLYQSQFAQ